MQKKPRGFGLLPSCVYCPWHKASCQEQDSAAKTLYSLAGHAHTKQRHLTTKLSTLLCWFCPSPGSMPRPGSSAIPEGPGGELWYHSPEEHRAISAAELSIVVCSGVRACPVIRSWTSSGEAAWERLEGNGKKWESFHYYPMWISKGSSSSCWGWHPTSTLEIRVFWMLWASALHWFASLL